MEFNVGAAIVAGLAGGTAMSVLLYMGIAMMPNQMKMNLFLMVGTMMFKGGGPAYVAGAMMHAVMSVVFGLMHVGVYTALDIDSGLAAWGIVLGFGHWLVSGVGLGMVPFTHPLMRRGQMASPGVLALKYPPMTAMGFFMLHILYGVVVAAFYAALT